VLPNILNRTILWELVKVFLLSLLVITGLILMAGIVVELSQHGFTPSQILAIIPLIIPDLLPYTIPATTLLATCMVYGRLAADNEIIAIKAAGINILTVIWPGIFLGLLMSGTTMALYYHVIPHTHHLLRSVIIDDVEEFLYGQLRKDHCINDRHLGYSIWVQQVHGRTLQTAVFKRRDPKAKDSGKDFDIVVRAREARLRVDTTNQQLLVYMRHGEVYSESGTDSAYFEEKIWEVPLNSSSLSANGPRKPRALSWWELFQQRGKVLSDLAGLEERTAQAVKLFSATDASKQQLPKHLEHLQNARLHLLLELYSLNAEIQMRPALAMGCFCFVLVGGPVGIWFSRSDYLSAFITCFLPIVFLYYPMLLCGTNLAKAGTAPAAGAIWAADAAMGLIGLALFRKLLKN
jgi:lipopolysaccharide export system permease protein